MDLVRLAIPRRTYTQSRLDYVIEVATRCQLAGVPVQLGGGELADRVAAAVRH